MDKLQQVIPIDSYWLISEAARESYLDMIAGVDPVVAAEKQAEVFAAASSRLASKEKPYEVSGKTAIVRLTGPLTKAPTSMSWLIGGSSTAMARIAIRAAKQDTAIDSLMVVLDSPGGQVDGTEQLANDIRAFGKPTSAFVSGTCCSAALWIASACDSIQASGTTDTIGSIGVITSITDVSRLYENNGVKVNVISSGDHKGTGTRGTVLTDAQKAEVQRHISALAASFKDAVMAGRGFDQETIDALADGRWWTAGEALDLGLIDGICDFDACLAQISEPRGSTTATDSRTVGKPPATGGDSNIPAAKAAHDTAPAVAVTAKETSMNPLAVMQKALAFVFGSTERMAEAGISTAEAAQLSASTRDVDPEVAEQLKVMREGNIELSKRIEDQETATLQTLAEAFAFDAIEGRHKADPKERESLAATFMMAARADGNGKRPAFAEGKLVEGANMKAVRDGIDKRETIAIVGPGRLPNARPGIDQGTPVMNIGQIVGMSVAMTNGRQIRVTGGQK